MHASILKVKPVSFVANMDYTNSLISELNASTAKRNIAYLNLNINYKTVQSRFMHFRRCISNYCELEARKLYGELELDESYFGGKRKGNRGRGAKNKAIVFGILERKGKIHTVI